MVNRQCDPQQFGTRGICCRTHCKTTRPAGARYLSVAASAPQAPGSQTERHRVKRHAHNTRATFRSQFRLRTAQHMSTPATDTPFTPVRNTNRQPTISRTSQFRRCERTGTVRNALSNAIQWSIYNRTRRTQLGPSRTARRARGRTQLLNTAISIWGPPREPTRPEFQSFDDANPPEPLGTPVRTPHNGQSTMRPQKFGTHGMCRRAQRTTTRP